MTDGPDGTGERNGERDIENAASLHESVDDVTVGSDPAVPGASASFGAQPPAEDSTAERDMIFAPVTKVRGGQRETSTGSQAASGTPDNDNDNDYDHDDDPQPFHALQDDEAGVVEPSAWSTLREHRRFKLGAFAVVLAAVLLSGVLAWSVKTGTEAPRAQAEKFLDYLNAFDYQRAESMLDPQCSQGADAALLSGVFGGRNFQHNLTQSDISSSGAVVTGFVDVVGVGEVPVRVNLRFTGGDWIICGIGAR